MKKQEVLKDKSSQVKRNKFKWPVIILALVLLAIIITVIIFLHIGYPADAKAVLAMNSDDKVTVVETSYGWLFDGPSDDSALVFYPGAYVESTAYAPLLRELATNGLDVCLLKVPLSLAVFAPNAADEALKEHNYENWYIGGHSLGGVMACKYASGHPDSFAGVILFASYPNEKLPDNIAEIIVVGSEDKVLNWSNLEKGRSYSSNNYIEYVVQGGNHAQFGSYGEQRGDGEASISAEEQIRIASTFVIEKIKELVTDNG